MSKKKKRVIVAEDDSFLSRMMREELERHDIDAVVALDGKEAVKAIEKQKPDLLLIDLLMPVMDGYAVLEHVRDKGYTFPVVVSTNVGDRMDQKKCRKLGCSRYLLKSDMDDDSLWPSIEKYLK